MRTISTLALSILVMAGCGKKSEDLPLNAVRFETQWVKMDGSDYILVHWSGDQSKPKDNLVGAYRYEAMEGPSDHTIWIYGTNPLVESSPLTQVVVDPRRVASDLQKLQIKALTQNGWVDVPVPARVPGMDKFWSK